MSLSWLRNHKVPLAFLLLLICLLGGALVCFPPLWGMTETAAGQLTMEESVCKQPIDLNRATLEQLMSLEGIGEVKARAILDYRREIGAFNDVTQAAQVKGISLETAEKWKKENLVICKEEFP